MPPAVHNQNLRWQPTGRSSYAARLDEEEWARQEGHVMALHAEGRTKREILELLASRHNFHPSYGQLRKRLDRWIIKANRVGSFESTNRRGSASTSRSSDARSWTNGPTQEEEQVFKMFTSILDEDAAGEDETLATSLPKSRRPHFHQSRARHETSSGSVSASPAHANSIPFPTPARLKGPESASDSSSRVMWELAIDSDCEMDAAPVPGPMLGRRLSPSPDTREFEDFYRQKRPPGVSSDGESDIIRTAKSTRKRPVAEVRNKMRLRLRAICCACGKQSQLRLCKNCRHPRCERCGNTEPVQNKSEEIAQGAQNGGSGLMVPLGLGDSTMTRE